jgi:hypothetical protein
MQTKKEKISEELQRSIKKGQWDQAVQALDKLSKFEPKNATYRLRKGDYCLKINANQEAIRAYHEAASLFSEGGFIIKALAAYKMILRLNPKDQTAHERMQNLQAQTRPSVGAQPPIITAEAAEVAEVSAPDEGAFQATQEPVAESMPAAEKQTEPEPEMLEEGVVGVQPMDFESLATPMQGELPAGERVEVAAAGDLKMELTSLAGEPVGEAEQPATGPSEPEAPPAPDRPTNVIPLFLSLKREEFKEVVERMVHLNYPSRYTVIKEGEEGNSVFVIARGKVKVVTRIGDQEVYLTDLTENDFFGEVGFLTGRPRTASVITTGETEILELRGEDLKEIVKRYPGVREVLENFYRARVKDTIAKVKNERAVV